MTSKTSHPWWVLVGTGLSALSIAIDFTIVNTVLANIQLDLHATIGQLQWVMAGFGLLFCTFLSVLGRLGDIIGRRLLLYIGIVGFGLASLGAGLSQSPEQLIFFRFLQGAAGAIILPCGSAIVANTFPASQRGRGMGIYGSILGIGLAIGPVLGGFIVSILSWRWIFLINLPIVFVSLVICFTVVRESKLSERIPIDWWGFLFIALFVAALIYAINQSPILGWTSPVTLSTLVFAVICLITAYFLETKIKHPMIPPHVFTNHGFLLSVIIATTSISFAWAIIFLIPLYLHNVLDKDPSMVGLLLLPMTALTAIVPAWAGYLYDRKGSLSITILTFIFLIVGLGLQLFFNVSENLWIILLAFITYGFAWGIGNGVIIPVALSQLKSADDAGIISGTMITILNIAGVFSLSVGVTLFRYVEQANLYANISLQQIQLNESQRHTIRAMLSNPQLATTYITRLGAEGKHIMQLFRQSFVYGYHVMVMMFLVLSIVSFILALAILRKMQ